MTTPDYWHKQTISQPLFEELAWSRPENKSHAGKLLIVGGNLHGFAAPAQAYTAAQKAGIGSTRIVLPNSLKSVAGPVLETGEYAPSTPSGSFSVKALDELRSGTLWADGVLIAGDLGRNSETALLLEKYLQKCSQTLLTLTKDAVDYFMETPETLLTRPSTTLVLSFAQLQKLASRFGHNDPFTFDMGLVQLAQILHDLSKYTAAGIMVKYLEYICVAVGGQVSTTQFIEDTDIWRVKYAASAATWWLQNPSKQFEALTTSVIT